MALIMQLVACNIDMEVDHVTCMIKDKASRKPTTSYYSYNSFVTRARQTCVEAIYVLVKGHAEEGAHRTYKLRHATQLFTYMVLFVTQPMLLVCLFVCFI